MNDPAVIAVWKAGFGLLAFLWGASVGSFLNVCVYRIPRQLSVVKPRSHCPHCRHPIPWYHNIPLLSYVLLRARCRYCGARIIARYVLIELLVAALFLLVWLKYALVPGAGRPFGLDATYHLGVVLAYWLAVAGLVLGTFVDLEHMIIPDRVSLGGIAAGLLLSAAVPALHGVRSPSAGLCASTIGAATGWGLLWMVARIGRIIFRKEAMGFGDVKLLGAIGAFLGWRAVLFTIMVSSLAGSVIGLALIIMQRKDLQSRIPYGPYLALAAVIWMLWGHGILAFYSRLFAPAWPAV